MQKSHHTRNNRRDVVFGAVTLVVVLADQLSKLAIRTSLTLGQVYYDAGVFQIVHVQNTGVAFGLFREHTQVIIVLVFIEIIVLLLIAFFLRRQLSPFDSMPARAGLGLILGGAIGNQIDRLHLGYVTDFFDFKVWPAFNVADASAVVGAIIIAIAVLFLARSAGQRA
jgi:signal peptidase II